MSKTERQRVEELLDHSINGLSPEEISQRLSTREKIVSEKDVIKHIEHIKKSLEHEDERVMVMPPYCLECGYDNFDNLLNIPSQCPSSGCYSERIAEPRYLID